MELFDTQTLIDPAKPVLEVPFPKVVRFWTDPKTGLEIPKFRDENIEWRIKLLRQAENDVGLQQHLLAASKQSLLFWLNTFVWTYHQFDVDDEGHRIEAVCPHVPFITWTVQDKLFDKFIECLKTAKDVLIDKTRDMGASWCCVAFLHWLWLFRPDSQLLELSRTEQYVDQSGNMKALFQKHDYINQRLPDWMRPPECLTGERNRTKMHIKNELNGSVIDGESTTPHASRGDKRLVGLLDEFAMVEHGPKMRAATRDACYMRIINSTVAGPGTEYSKWKNSGQIGVFVMPFWEHPEKGYKRYTKKNETGKWEIRSPWFDVEEKIRSPQELAKEILRQDIESGAIFFTTSNFTRHIAEHGKNPMSQWNIRLKTDVSRNAIPRFIGSKDKNCIVCEKKPHGQLKLWVDLVDGRPDQTKSYTFGIDVSRGQGASNSVISIKCDQTQEKIGEWCDANTPPYDMAYIVAALALWCGGCRPRPLPMLVWENNGPGWDLGHILVKDFCYPYYYRHIKPGRVTNKKTESYGFHTDRQSKFELLSLYDRILAHGTYINHSIEALEEAKLYVYFADGGIGPACLIEESSSAKKTHGDRVMADALTNIDAIIVKPKLDEVKLPENSCGYRMKKALGKKKGQRKKSWRRSFDFSGANYHA